MTLYVFQKGRDIKYILETIKLNALLVERMFLSGVLGTIDQFRYVFLIEYSLVVYLKYLLRGYKIIMAGPYGNGCC